MFCEQCGTPLEDGASTCPACGAPAPKPVRSGPAGAAQRALDSGKPQAFLVKAAVVVAAVLFIALAVKCLVRMAATLVAAGAMFALLDAGPTVLGFAGIIVCGLLLAGLAIAAVVPLVKAAFASDNAAINRYMKIAFGVGIAFFVVCVAALVCKAVFGSITGDSVSTTVLYFIFLSYGGFSTSNIVMVLIALVILYLVRVKVLLREKPAEHPVEV